MTRLLVYNRGEIAVRACLAARRLGIRSILFLSPPDALSPAVRFADELHVDEALEPARAFLDLAALRRAIAETGATHVYPGYGFLSESPELARAVREAGASFVGPSEEILTLMAHKGRAQAFAESAGLAHLAVPLLSTPEGVQAPTQAAFPLLLKASYGGGGRGNLVVDSSAELSESHRKLQARALALFGSADLLAERYLPEARHVELQVFGVNGQVLALGTRDCSVQRKHQKVIEEGPAARAAESKLAPYLEPVCRALARLGYRGAGTLEFLFEPRRGDLYFLEMNTRIQVEHTVSELLFGIDLVEWQLREACDIASETLPSELLPARGHAIEARIYAEDASSGFTPDTGVLHHLELPRMPFVRWDVGVDQGGQVTPFFDPMIAKLVVWGSTRAQALARLGHALDHAVVHGAKTNLSFLRELVRAPRFVADSHDTGWLEREFLRDLPAAPQPASAAQASLLREAAPTATSNPQSELLRWKLHHRF
jgi:acetyl/propionyl-CoA carboxylase alpha subunit